MDKIELVGKTIKCIVNKKNVEFDDSYTEIIFTDGTKVILEPMYMWTGESKDEYSKYIVFRDPDDYTKSLIDSE